MLIYSKVPGDITKFLFDTLKEELKKIKLEPFLSDIEVSNVYLERELSHLRQDEGVGMSERIKYLDIDNSFCLKMIRKKQKRKEHYGTKEIRLVKGPHVFNKRYMKKKKKTRELLRMGQRRSRLKDRMRHWIYFSRWKRLNEEILMTWKRKVSEAARRK